MKFFEHERNTFFISTNRKSNQLRPRTYSHSWLDSAHGILFVLQEPHLTILQVSNNTFEFLGIHPQQFLGNQLKDFLEAQLIQSIQKKVAEELGSINLLKLSITTQKGKFFFDGILHRSGGMLILELEHVDSKEVIDFFSLYNLDS